MCGTSKACFCRCFTCPPCLNLYIFVHESGFQRGPDKLHFSSRLTDAVVVIYVVVLLYCALISPSFTHTHAEANRGCHPATVLSLLHHTLGSWQAGISLLLHLLVNGETGSKANEGSTRDPPACARCCSRQHFVAILLFFPFLKLNKLAICAGATNDSKKKKTVFSRDSP